MELSVGGTVIGPLPEVRFRRGFAGCARASCWFCARTGSSSGAT